MVLVKTLLELVRTNFTCALVALYFMTYSISQESKITTQPIKLFHSNIYGPMNKKPRHGASYFLTLIDDYSLYDYVYLLSHRHEALDCFKRFVAEVENKHEKGLKTFRTDRGREYLFDQFKEFCVEKGIQRYLTIPRTSQ